MTEEVVTPDEVELIIRPTYQSNDDFTFSCPTSWTILQIKQHVRTSLPSHPAVSTQRLIFSGASLQDTQVLSDILKQRSVVDGAQVFHLVCAQPYAAQEIRQRTNASTTTPTQPVDISVPTANVPAPNSVEWNQWWQTTYGHNAQAYQAQYNAYYAEYVRHYYSQFIPQNQGNVVMINGNHIIRNGVFEINQNPAAAPQPVNPVAAPAPGERVDALEIFYRLFKLVLLLSAILLYSSFERFALVLCAALFIYFVQLRRNYVRNRQRRGENAAAAPPAAANAARQDGNQQQPPQPVNNNNTGENENNAAVNDTNSESENEPNRVVEESRPTGMQVFISTCYSFITSFFASLVPDHPMPVDIN